MEEVCNGPGYRRFVEIVLPAFLEDVEWPCLKSIRLFGFETDHPEEKGDRIDLVSQLSDRFGDGVEVRNGRGRAIMFEEKTRELYGYDGDEFDSFYGFDDEDREGTPWWQCRPASATSDWIFGGVHRLS